MLALFENGRLPCLLTSRASTLRTRWSLSGYLENVAPQDSLVPDWFIRIFTINETLSISADVTTLDCDDGLKYWCLLLPESQTSSAQPHVFDAVLETLAIIAHATSELGAEIGWDIIERQLRRPLQDIYIMLLSFTALMRLKILYANGTHTSWHLYSSRLSVKRNLPMHRLSSTLVSSPSDRSSRCFRGPLSIHKLTFTHVVRPIASRAEAYKEQCYICKGAHAKYLTAHGLRISSQYLESLLVTAFISRQSRDHCLAIAIGR
jgi:hypothetical protein